MTVCKKQGCSRAAKSGQAYCSKEHSPYGNYISIPTRAQMRIDHESAPDKIEPKTAKTILPASLHMRDYRRRKKAEDPEAFTAKRSAYDKKRKMMLLRKKVSDMTEEEFSFKINFSAEKISKFKNRIEAFKLKIDKLKRMIDYYEGFIERLRAQRK